MDYKIPTPEEAGYPSPERNAKKVIPLILEAIESKTFTFKTDIEFNMYTLNVILNRSGWKCKAIGRSEDVSYTLVPYTAPSDSYWDR